MATTESEAGPKVNEELRSNSSRTQRSVCVDNSQVVGLVKRSQDKSQNMQRQQISLQAGIAPVGKAVQVFKTPVKKIQ